jgi:AraC family transcriptional regulator of arabinose operon
MPSDKETPSPPAGPLHARYWDSRGHVHGWRPRGTRDWLFLYTVAGNCLVRFAGGQFTAGPGDAILYQPGTPQDYGQHDPRGRWRNVWVHWVPRAEIIPWLAWPELSPGLRHLRLPRELRGAVLRELVLADSALRARQTQGEFLALNAIERALLFCHRVNPRGGDPRWHPRIQQAVDHLARNLRERHVLENTARRFGFSRSRFALLFRRQVGLTPGQYLEMQRLSQARHLLAYTDQTLARIADQVGFSSPFYLSLRFKKQQGQSPRAYRQKQRKPGRRR